MGYVNLIQEYNYQSCGKLPTHDSYWFVALERSSRRTFEVAYASYYYLKFGISNRSVVPMHISFKNEVGDFSEGRYEILEGGSKPSRQVINTAVRKAGNKWDIGLFKTKDEAISFWNENIYIELQSLNEHLLKIRGSNSQAYIDESKLVEFEEEIDQDFSIYENHLWYHKVDFTNRYLLSNSACPPIRIQVAYDRKSLPLPLNLKKRVGTTTFNRFRNNWWYYGFKYSCKDTRSEAIESWNEAIERNNSYVIRRFDEDRAELIKLIVKLK